MGMMSIIPAAGHGQRTKNAKQKKKSRKRGKEAYFDAVNREHDRVLRDAGLREKVKSGTARPSQ
jgi:hypothetical protein